LFELPKGDVRLPKLFTPTTVFHSVGKAV